MSSFSSLGIAFSGLRASQKAMEVVANNIANVNTEGYTRQRVELANARPVPGTFGRRGDGMRGMGVTIADVIRIRSTLADTSFRTESGVQASWSAQAEIMGRAEQVLGPVNGGAPKALADFFGGWEELSLQPDSPSARRVVIQAGETLAGSFRSAAANLGELRDGVAGQVRDTVDQVNRLAAQVANLNAGIADATNGQQSPNDLLDQRDRLLDQLSSLAGVTVRPAEMGTVDVYIGGRALVRGETVEKLVAQNETPETIRWELDSPTAAAIEPGGRLGGLAAGAQQLETLREELDDVANDLRMLVNEKHRQGYALDGPPATNGHDFFGGTGAAGLAVSATTTTVAASKGSAATDGNHALDMAALRNEIFTGSGARTGKTPIDGLHAFAARLGGLASDTASNAADSAEILKGLHQDRAQISSVSTDEEMADMVRFQRSYEASARLMTTIDEMLDRLINHTGLVGR